MDAATVHLLEQTGLINGALGLSYLPSSGWTQPPDVWTYGSATTFKTLGVNTVARYAVGTKLSCTDASVAKYFSVVSSVFSTDTTVTITGGSDYTLSGGAISNPMYSYMATPYGFPGRFAFTPSSYSGWTATPTFTCWLAFYQGHVDYWLGITGTSTTGATNIVLPFASAAAMHISVRAVDNTSTNLTGIAALNASSSTVVYYKDASATAFTTSGAKTISEHFLSVLV